MKETRPRRLLVLPSRLLLGSRTCRGELGVSLPFSIFNFHLIFNFYFIVESFDMYDHPSSHSESSLHPKPIPPYHIPDPPDTRLEVCLCPIFHQYVFLSSLILSLTYSRFLLSSSFSYPPPLHSSLLISQFSILSP